MSTPTTRLAADNTELAAALAAAEAGDTILLTNPDTSYKIQLRNRRFDDDGINIIADPTLSSEISAEIVQLESVTGLTVRNIVLDSSDAYQTRAAYLTDVYIRNSSGITLDNLQMIGTAEHYLGSPEEENISEDAILIARSSDIYITSSSISNYKRAINIHDFNENILIENNKIDHIQADGITIAGGKNIDIINNYFSEFLGSNYSLSHVDFVQVWNVGGPGPVNGLTVRDNVFLTDFDNGSQSVFINNELGDAPHQNINIHNNIIYNGHRHGIFVNYASGVNISGNTLIPNFAARFRKEDDFFQDVTPPVIFVSDNSRSVEISKNVASQFLSGDRTTFNDNKLLEIRDKGLENFIDKNFIYTGWGGALTEEVLRFDPSGLFHLTGAGASRSVYDPSPDSLTPVFSATESLSRIGEFVFDASLTAGPDGPLDESNAVFSWNFDGVARNGVVATHAFDGLGWRTAQLSVSYEGFVETIELPIYIANPILVGISFDLNDVADYSNNESVIKWNPYKAIFSEIYSDSLYYLTDDNDITIDRSNAQIFSLDAVTFSMGIQRDMGTDSAGALLVLHNSLLVSVSDEGEVAFWLRNADGFEARAVTSGADITDERWRHVGVSYSQAEERMKIFVDGELLGEAAMTGSTAPMASWGLVIGHPWSSNFNGLISNFEMRRTGMTAEQAVAAHEELVAGRQGGIADAPQGDAEQAPTNDAGALHPFQPGVQSFGGIAVENGSATLSGNSWAYLDVSETIAPETVAHFTFDAPTTGEIHAIGFLNGGELDEARFFKLHGSQSWGVDAYDGDFAGNGPQGYRIEVGDFFTGDVDRIVFVADDDATRAGTSVFGDLRLVEEAAPGIEDVASSRGYGFETADVDESFIFSHAPGVQDVGRAQITDAGALLIKNNAWKAQLLNASVTVDTVLRFTHEVKSIGEIHAIGFSNGDDFLEDRFFRIAGTQDWGINDFASNTNQAETVDFEIPVGQYFTGDFERLVFVSDDDLDGSGEGVFSGIEISAQTGDDQFAPLAVF